jgi:hypothetical protein
VNMSLEACIAFQWVRLAAVRIKLPPWLRSVSRVFWIDVLTLWQNKPLKCRNGLIGYTDQYNARQQCVTHVGATLTG